MSKSRPTLAFLTFCITLLVLCAGAARAEHHEGEVTVVHLSKFGNDLHAVNMALKLGTALQENGARVTLFVDLEGVRLADKRQPHGTRWGDGMTVGEYYDAFVGAGGKVLVCPHCAAAAGIEASSLRKGAEIGTTETIVELLAAAAKILDY